MLCDFKLLIHYASDTLNPILGEERAADPARRNVRLIQLDGAPPLMSVHRQRHFDTGFISSTQSDTAAQS
jgi:hypothetical protein